jgi:drug/metabolite transporter (DMT)-like permease
VALSDHARGYLITLAGVLIVTPDSLLIRLAALEPFTLTVWRGAIAGATVLALSIYWYRGEFLSRLRGLGRWGLVVACLNGISTLLFVNSLEHTSAANVLIFFATMPLIAATMAWVLYREQVPPVTWAAILATLVGVVIVVSGSLGSGNLFGDMLALTNAFTLAGFLVLVRRHREVSMVPAMGLGLLLGAVLAAFLADFEPMQPVQWLWVGLGSTLVLPGALVLITIGLRYLSAPETGMLMLLETVLGPFWVWLVLAEQPGIRSLIGGAIIVTALFLHALVRLRSGRRA